MQTQIATYKAHQATIEVYDYNPKRAYCHAKVIYVGGGVAHWYPKSENLGEILNRFDGVEK